MPMAIPLVAAAFEAYAGVAAFAAGVEGLSAVAAGLEIAGGALTAVGTITGNKNLVKIGSIAGLGGGALSLGAGLAGAGNGLTVDAAGQGIDAGGHGYSAAQDGLIQSSMSPEASAATDQFAAITPANSEFSPGLTGEEQDQVGLMSDQAGAGRGSVNPPNVTPDAPAAPSAPDSTGYAAPGTGNPGNASPDYGSATGPGAPGTSGGANLPDSAGISNDAATKSWYDSFGDTLKKGAKVAQDNPQLTKVAGGLIQGGMNYYGDQAKADANLKRAQSYQDWVRQRYSDSVKNLAVPTAQVTKGPSSGIIAGARA